MAAPGSTVAAGSTAAPGSTGAPGSTAVPGSAGTTGVWAAPAGPWTEPDLRRFPADGQRYEIVDGCLLATPAPGPEHERLVDTIVSVLDGTAPPNWRPITRLGVRLGGNYLIPDAVVIRPGTPGDPAWVDAADLALVVEVESAHSRRVDRCLKPALYAEAGIESYWRLECTTKGPVAHLYTRAAAGHYHLHRSVHAGQCVTAELPYAVQLAPATWH